MSSSSSDSSDDDCFDDEDRSDMCNLLVHSYDGFSSEEKASKRSKIDKNTPRRPILTWRLPQEESLSDWTVTIHSTGNAAAARTEATEAVFHVHTYMLGVGPRRSEYFVRLFQTDMLESKARASIIHLDHQAAADAFPAMLDFMYDPSEDVAGKTATQAVALRHLASYFGMEELYDNVSHSFILPHLEDIIVANKAVDPYLPSSEEQGSTGMFEYTEAATIFQDDAVLLYVLLWIALPEA